MTYLTINIKSRVISYGYQINKVLRVSIMYIRIFMYQSTFELSVYTDSI